MSNAPQTIPNHAASPSPWRWDRIEEHAAAIRRMLAHLKRRQHNG